MLRSQGSGTSAAHASGAPPGARVTLTVERVPVYPIRTVVRLTGVSAYRIRALERYHLIAPARTEGGHRLYAEEDVERIRWIKAMRESGASLESVWQAVQGCRDGCTELPRCPSNSKGSE